MSVPPPPAGLAPGNRILMFGLVGSVGFVVDAGVLALLIGGIGPWWGRCLSFPAAVVTTWLLNRRLTFADRPSRHSRHGEFGRYFLVMCIGGAVNYGVYGLVLALLGPAGLFPYLGLAAGSLAGMGVNLTLAHYAVFRP